MTEFEWIDQLKKRFSLKTFPKTKADKIFSDSLTQSLLGIGDDCTVLPSLSPSLSPTASSTEKQNEESLLISTDLLVEGVHFVLDWFSLEELGWKAVAVNLSDIASMGGIPLYIWVCIAIPPKIPLKGLDSFYTGIEKITQKYEVSLLGGDTSKSLDSLFISITILGKSLSHEVLTRSSAKANDWIYVTGTLGDSSAGLSILKDSSSAKNDHDPKIQELIHRHKMPKPRIQEMLNLKKKYRIHSAIDLSDGISGDLRHITKQSQVGAEIYWEKLPLSNPFKNKVPRKEWETHVLHGGEDYEILFTSPEEIDPLFLNENYSLMVHKIGRILNQEGNVFIRDGKRISLVPKSYEHFH